jgi:hypothetical protein
MKKEGIYSLICPYWALTVKPPKGWGVDVPEGKDAHNLLYFDPKMRALYKNWLRILLTEKNPYTNIALKDDPALAILQLQNEDSLFFWTFDTMSDSQKRTLGALYGAWLAKKYGSLDGAQKFWATGDKASTQNDAAVSVPGDDFAQGVAAMYPTWEFTQSSNVPEGKARRKADQMQFLATTMREFNADIAKYVRGLGAKCLINSTNWRPADTLRMGDAERWSNAANPVLAVNRYTGSVHEGKDNGWAIRAGDFYNPSWSQLKDPAGFPLTLKPAQGSPMLVTKARGRCPRCTAPKARFWCRRMALSRESGRISSSSTPTTNGRSPHRPMAMTRTRSSSGRTPSPTKWASSPQRPGWRVWVMFRKRSPSSWNSGRSKTCGHSACR